jgi:cell division protein FtsI (penicillin-binding protein 3)
LSPRPTPQRPDRRAHPLFRLRFGFVVIAMVLSVFGVRLVQLQGIDPKAYAAMAAREGSVKVVLPAERGAITDRNGVGLATSVDGMMVVADPQMTHDDAAPIATYLADELDLDYFQTLDRLRTGGGSRFVYIARRVPSTIANRVLGELEDRGFKGLSVRRDPMRDYPARDVAANLIGFLGEDVPLAGLERTFDAQLSGQDGEATYEVGGGNRIPLGDSTTVEPRDGADLRLTIDRDVQWYVQRVLRSTVRGANGDSGVAVVMDTRTGEILSLADYPSFDAQRPLSSRKADLGSRALSDVFEPGSVEKVLTAASLIDAGRLSPLTHIQVPHELPRPGAAPIHDHWEHDLLRYTLAGVISRSSNIGTVLAARKFAPEELHGYLREFGLGEKTDIGVRGETAGLLADPSLWTQGTQDTIAFGQGLSVNAVQMAAAINTIANRGVRVDPSLIRGRATTDEGSAVGTGTTTEHRVVSARAAKQTMLMMELVTDVDDGVAPGAAIPGYRVAGKTGTAQRAGKDGRYDDTFTVSFAGFAPADQPRFTVYVLVQNPRNGGGGGSVAGPAFSKIMSYLLRRYAVPPTGTKPSTYPVEY